MGVEVNHTAKGTAISVESTTKRRNNDISNFKYLKLGYHYLVSHAMLFISLPLSGVVLVRLSAGTLEDFALLSSQLRFNLATMILWFVLTVFLGTLFLVTRLKKVYLVDFACYKPGPEFMCSKEHFIEASREISNFTDESLAFQKKILERSGMGRKTYIPESLVNIPGNLSMAETRKEAEMVMFGAIDQLFAKTGVKSQEIGILVVNCCVFFPSPSLSSMIVNHYKLRANIRNYNLSGMGCSAGLISIDLAKQLLQVSFQFSVFPAHQYFLTNEQKLKPYEARIFFNLHEKVNHLFLCNRQIPTLMP